MKGLIKSRKSKKDGEHNDQKKKRQHDKQPSTIYYAEHYSLGNMNFTIITGNEPMFSVRVNSPFPQVSASSVCYILYCSLYFYFIWNIDNKRYKKK